METEKEVRYKIIDQLKLQEIIKNTEEVEEKNQTIDLVMGWKGFDSLNEYGFICRIRQKRNNVLLEIKKRISENEWQESKIPLDSFKRGYEFLKLLGMDAYLYINRKRQIRKYKDLLIFIDEVDMLGDFVEVGCNSVLCPGTVIGKNSTVYPLSRVRGFIKENSIFKSETNITEKIWIIF